MSETHGIKMAKYKLNPVRVQMAKYKLNPVRVQ